MAEMRDHLAGVGVVFVHGDWLGTERARSSASGVICQTETSLPFGNDAVVTGGCTVASPDFFTGKPRDAETGLDDFGARYLSSQWGRWMSADWTAGASAVPYATLTNPQSLNLYAYVGNDPVDGMDPDGHARYTMDGADASVYGDMCTEYGGTDCVGPSGEGGPSGVAAEPASGQQPVSTGAQTPAPSAPGTSSKEFVKEQIEKDNKKFNECVADGLPKAELKAMASVMIDAAHEATEAAKQASESKSGSKPPEPKQNPALKVASEVTAAVVELHQECLAEHPLAVISPNYQGTAMPGDAGRVPAWLEFLSDLVK